MRPSRSSFVPALPVLVALVLVAPACAEGADGPPVTPAPSGSTASAFPLTLVDDDGVRVTIPSEPRRIVTFAPSMTEIVFALGLGERLVGVSGPADDYPAAARRIEEIGGAGDFGVDPNIERVVDLEPDLFLTISGGDQWKAELRDIGVPVVTLNASDLEDLLADIVAVGEVTGARDEAVVLAGDMEDRAASLMARSTDRVTCFFEVYFPPLMSVGPNTFIYDLLERAGCDPVTADAASDYPEWSLDELVASGPDAYLVTTDSTNDPRTVAERPGFDAIPAVAEGHVVLVDAGLITRPGPRVIDGLEQLEGALRAAEG